VIGVNECETDGVSEPATTVPLLIFDGDCSFCTSSAHWIERRISQEVTVIAWQFIDDLGALGLTIDDVNAKVWWITPDGDRRGGHLAIGDALKSADRFWAVVGHALVLPPLTWLARPVYAVIARYRHRMPGGTPACRIDAPR
jgi:predicted DCC family thiol-disulfide oxidoreductase YuxK